MKKKLEFKFQGSQAMAIGGLAAHQNMVEKLLSSILRESLTGQSRRFLLRMEDCYKRRKYLTPSQYEAVQRIKQEGDDIAAGLKPFSPPFGWGYKPRKKLPKGAGPVRIISKEEL
jgi:hypothetical protein